MASGAPTQPSDGSQAVEYPPPATGTPESVDVPSIPEPPAPVLPVPPTTPAPPAPTPHTPTAAPPELTALELATAPVLPAQPPPLPPAHAAPTGHPLVPTLSLTTGATGSLEADVVVPETAPPTEWVSAILTRVSQVASGAYTPLSMREGNLDFQIPRAGAVSL